MPLTNKKCNTHWPIEWTHATLTYFDGNIIHDACKTFRETETASSLLLLLNFCRRWWKKKKIEYRTRFQIAVVAILCWRSLFWLLFFFIAHAKVVPAVQQNSTNSLLLLFFLFLKNIFSLLFCYCAIIWQNTNSPHYQSEYQPGRPFYEIAFGPVLHNHSCPFLYPVQPRSPITEKTTHCPFS